MHKAYYTYKGALLYNSWWSLGTDSHIDSNLRRFDVSMNSDGSSSVTSSSRQRLTSVAGFFVEAGFFMAFCFTMVPRGGDRNRTLQPRESPRTPRLPSFLSQIFTDDMYVYSKVGKIPRWPPFQGYHNSKVTATPRLPQFLGYHKSWITSIPRLPQFQGYCNSKVTIPRIPQLTDYQYSNATTKPRLSHSKVTIDS